MNLRILTAATVVLVSFAALASAADVSKSTLIGMGFGNMQQMSDTDGLAIRGKGTSASVWGESNVAYRGHTAVNGGPFRLEMELIRPWVSLLAIKDMLWEKDKGAWHARVVPVGDGIVRWSDVGAAVKEAKFQGTVSLHGEYETKDLAERKELAKRELTALKKLLG